MVSIVTVQDWIVIGVHHIRLGSEDVRGGRGLGFFPLITALRGCAALVKVGTIIGRHIVEETLEVLIYLWMEGTSDQELIGRG